MANITLAYPNRIDQGTVSGGSWLTTLPLVNIQNRRLSKLARSSNLLVASTQFNISLSASRSIGCVALVNHNLSVSATVRIRGNSTNSFTTPLYDSGQVSVWPSGMIPQALLEWEDDNFWLGTVAQEAIAGYKAPFAVFFNNQNLQYFLIEITDTGNPAGYVQVGRVFLGKTFTPTVGMSLNNTLGRVDVSVFDTALTGEEFIDQKTQYQVFNFNLEYLSKDEAYATLLDMQTQLGTTGELFVSGDPADVSNAPRRNFLGRMQSLRPITQKTTDLRSQAKFTNQLEIRGIL